MLLYLLLNIDFEYLFYFLSIKKEKQNTFFIKTNLIFIACKIRCIFYGHVYEI